MNEVMCVIVCYPNLTKLCAYWCVTQTWRSCVCDGVLPELHEVVRILVLPELGEVGPEIHHEARVVVISLRVFDPRHAHSRVLQRSRVLP